MHLFHSHMVHTVRSTSTPLQAVGYTERYNDSSHPLSQPTTRLRRLRRVSASSNRRSLVRMGDGRVFVACVRTRRLFSLRFLTSLSCRYYYNTSILLPVGGRRLVYKFGPNAVHWRHSVDSGTVFEPNKHSIIIALTDSISETPCDVNNNDSGAKTSGAARRKNRPMKTIFAVGESDA